MRVAEKWADMVGGVPLAFIHKSRDKTKPNEVVANRVVGEVERTHLHPGRRHDRHRRHHREGHRGPARGRRLRRRSSPPPTASSPDPAVERLSTCGAREVIVTNTLPIPDEKRFPHLTVLSIAPLIARAVREVFEDGSVTNLFDGNA